MKIISLNTWGGRALHPLMHFLKRHGPTTDVFCLQEMHDTTREYREAHHPDEYVCWDLWDRVRRVLPEHDGYMARWAEKPDRMTVATFVRKRRQVIDAGSRVVHVPPDIHEEGSAIIGPRKLQYVSVGTTRGLPLIIVNYHGMWRDGPKRDTPERSTEMTALAGFVTSFGSPLVLAGDLNLDPDTRAIRQLVRRAKLESLVNPDTIRGTRTPLYRHWGSPDYTMFADYIFTSTALARRKLEVMPDVVSDHAPLKLELIGW